RKEACCRDETRRGDEARRGDEEAGSGVARRGDERCGPDGLAVLRRWLGIAIAVPSMVLVGLLAGSLVSSGGGSGAGAARPRAGDPAREPAALGFRAARDAPAPGSVVADVRGPRVLVYHARDGLRPWRRYSNPTPQRTPLVFLVRARVG